MEVTRRDLGILGAFCVLLLIGGGLFVKSQSGPRPDPAELPTTRSGADSGQPELRITESPTPEAEPATMSSSLAPGEVPANYQEIVERKLFTPLVAVQSKPQPGATKMEPLPVPAPAVDKQTPVKSTETASKAEVKPTEKPEAPSTPATPPRPPLAVTGLVRAGDGYRVVVENTALNRSKVVRVGEDAFGYRITEVSAASGEVRIGKTDSPGGDEVTLKLGENKKVETEEAKPDDQGQTSKPSDSGQSSSSGSSGSTRPSGGFGGFDPSQLTPEQRARFEEYRRRRGSGGGGFSGRGGGDRGDRGR